MCVRRVKTQSIIIVNLQEMCVRRVKGENEENRERQQHLTVDGLIGVGGG